MHSLNDAFRFLQAIFPNYLTSAIFANLNPQGWMDHVRDYTALDSSRDCYWSIAAFPEGVETNKHGHALDVRALVIDDVGTKGPSEDAVLIWLGVPTTIVETSPGNFQYGYRLSKPVAKDDWPGFFGSVEALIPHGEPFEARGAQTLMRLPMGVNTKKRNKGFKVRLVTINRDIELDPDTVPRVQCAKTKALGPGETKCIRDIKTMMSFLPNSTKYHDWIAIGERIMALAVDEEEGREAWHEFSSRPLNSTYDAAETEEKWWTFTAERTKGGLLIKAVCEGIGSPTVDAWWQAEAPFRFDDGVDHEVFLAERMAGTVNFTLDQQQSARRVLKALNGTVRQIDKDNWRQFDPATGRWKVWPGNHMLRVVEALAETSKMAGGLSRGMMTKLGSKAFLSSVAQLAAINAEVIAVPGDFDKDPLLLGVPSGVIELGKGKDRGIRRGRIGEMVSAATAVDPAAAGAARPRWARFLSEFTQGDAALEEWLQVYAGYSLTGLSGVHLMPFFYGPTGGNGKGTYINTLLNTWGDYGAAVDHRLLFDKQGAGHSASLAATAGKRLGVLPDVDQGATWNIQMLKMLTGGDVIKADHKYGAPFDFRAMMKFLVSGQEVPGVKAMDGGLARRLKVVTLTAQPSVINDQLQTELKSEWSGILRWALEGLDLYWGLGGLPATRTIEDDTREYIEEHDVFGRFKREKLMRDPRAPNLLVDDIFKAWDDYRTKAGAYGMAPVNNIKMSGKLKEAGIKTHKGNKGAYVTGYKIKTVIDEEKGSKARDVF